MHMTLCSLLIRKNHDYMLCGNKSWWFIMLCNLRVPSRSRYALHRPSPCGFSYRVLSACFLCVIFWLWLIAAIIIALIELVFMKIPYSFKNQTNHHNLFYNTYIENEYGYHKQNKLQRVNSPSCNDRCIIHTLSLNV